jgi:hypothetical protein
MVTAKPLVSTLFTVFLLGGCVLDWDAPGPRRDTADTSDAASRTDGAADVPQHDVSADLELDLPPDLQGDDAPPTDSAADAIVLPTNQTCAKAQPITLVGSKASVSGDTSLSVDEHKFLKCKEAGKTTPTTSLDGPQLYYSWTVAKDAWYKLTLHPKTAPQYLYTFTGASCTEAAISTDCQSGMGHAMGVWHGDTEALYYQAPSTGKATFAVDSYAGVGGPFTATVEAITKPTNATCSTPQQITLSAAGKGSVSGDTGPVLTPDEFSTLRCDNSSGQPLKGPQVYYWVVLKAGSTYVISVTADAAASIYAYIFSGACTVTAIQADCMSSGVSGAVTGIATNGLTASLSFKPAKAGSYRIAVDSKYPAHFGGFTLKVEEQP